MAKTCADMKVRRWVRWKSSGSRPNRCSKKVPECSISLGVKFYRPRWPYRCLAEQTRPLTVSKSWLLEVILAIPNAAAPAPLRATPHSATITSCRFQPSRLRGGLTCFAAIPPLGGAVFDLQIVAAMLATGVKRIYTFDVDDFRPFPDIQTLTPA